MHFSRVSYVLGVFLGREFWILGEFFFFLNFIYLHTFNTARRPQGLACIQNCAQNRIIENQIINKTRRQNEQT